MKAGSGWERLRAWFLLPAWIWMATLFAAPFAIVVVYSLLTRGAYGGWACPGPWRITSGCSIRCTWASCCVLS